MAQPIINPLHAMHEQAEATFLPYGAEVQIVESYGEPEAEYAAIRRGTALFDAPHRSVVILTGRDRLTFLHNKLTNDTARLTPGQGCYAYLLNIKGRIVMDMNILQTEEATLAEMDRRLAPLFMQTMEKYIFTEDVRLLDGSGQLARLTVLGPKATLLLKKALDAGVETLNEDFTHGRRTIGRATVTVFRNDLAGEPQYELIVPRDQLVTLWQILHEAGGHDGGGGPSDPDLRAIGWSAFNTARIEAGSPLFGIDISEHYLPMETGRWYLRAVAVSKGCYIGQEIVARMHAHQSVAKLLAGLKVIGSDKLPLAGTDILDNTQQVGIITSSCFSPMLGNAPVAMGYVKKAYAPAAAIAETGTAPKEVELLAEGAHVKANVVPLPLWTKHP